MLHPSFLSRTSPDTSDDMSVWGKILGGAAGFALGGPIGALVGALAGHAVDRMSDVDGGAGANDATKQIAFTIGVIVLGAKLAKADGRVTRDEVDAFKQVFHIPADEMKNVGRVFDRAKRDVHGYREYAAQIAKLFRDSPEVLEDLLGALFHIARADGVVHPAEHEFLADVARIFGFSESHYQHLKAQFLGTAAEDPYSVLEVSPQALDAEIKAAYRRLIKQHHPDRLIAKGLPEEFIDIANQKLAAINAAYDRIANERGLS